VRTYCWFSPGARVGRICCHQWFDRYASAAVFTLYVPDELESTGLKTAVAISAAIGHISPFTTWGALYLATVASVVDKDAVLRSQLFYAVIAVCLLQALGWFLFISIFEFQYRRIT
jgi:hypothetical protein